MPLSEPILVSDSVTAEGDEFWRFKHIVAVIDSVHADGNIPLFVLRREVPKSGFGEGEFDPFGSVIRVHPDTDHLDLIAAHEIGHLVDYHGIGKGVDYASAKNAVTRFWKSAITNTDAYKHNNKLSKQSSTTVVAPDGKTVSHRIRTGYLDYLLDVNEMWARSYSQYVAQKSGDKALLDQILERRKKAGWTIYRDVWTESDFAPVYTEIDRLFGTLGWRIK